MKIIIQNIGRNKISLVEEVYSAVSYTGGAKPEDDCFVAKDSNKPVGAVRLSLENNFLVLRGMMVIPKYQRKGIGAKLLAALDKKIGSRKCFCINPPHLRAFYGSIGFRETDERNAPEFLQERINHYREKHHAEYIIMVKN